MFIAQVVWNMTPVTSMFQFLHLIPAPSFKRDSILFVKPAGKTGGLGGFKISSTLSLARSFGLLLSAAIQWWSFQQSINLQY